MKYRKPDYYDGFSCAAGECEATCCAGWQILIDEGKLEQYLQTPGSFGARLFRSVDWGEGAFLQREDGSCSFLNGKGLCDIYRELGPDMLCETCRSYPRHTEEFEGLRELSLSLSCPVAARLMLEQEGIFKLEEFSDDVEERWEDYEDFDELLFSQLLEAREALLAVVQEEGLPLGERMARCLRLGERLQDCLDGGGLFQIADCAGKEAAKARAAAKRAGWEAGSEELPEGSCCFERSGLPRFRLGTAMADILGRLETLREEWPLLLRRTKKALLEGGEKAYRKHWERFERDWGEKGPEAGRWNRYGRQLLLFFLYTYFCGAVYDGWIYSKVMLAVGSVLWIQELACAQWLEQGERLEEDDFIRLAYSYAREIEHSDDNLNALEEFFMEDCREKL